MRGQGRWLAQLMVWTLVCSLVGGGCGEDAASAPAEADSSQALDGTQADTVGELPDGPDGTEAVCTPGAVFCASVSLLAACAEDGESWSPLAYCPSATVCDSDASDCQEVVCEPDLPVCTSDTSHVTCNPWGTALGDEETVCGASHTCVDGYGCVAWACEPDALWCGDGGSLQRCRADGLAFDDVEPACGDDSCTWCQTLVDSIVCDASAPPAPATMTPCPEEHTCTGQGCEAWLCSPDTFGCLSSGYAAHCAASGFAWDMIPDATPCPEGPCVRCLDASSYVICMPGAEDGAATLNTCPDETTCVSGDGCKFWLCTPGEGQCLGNTYKECNPDGLAWTTTSCPAYTQCVASGANQGCDGGDPIGSAMLQGCATLPPVGDGSWVVPNDWWNLKLAFGVGAVAGASQVFVNLSPVVNTLTGGYITDLVPVTTVDGVTTGNIAVYEDGQPMEVQCVPLVSSDFAMVDMVFLLDVTGSMSGTIEKVKESAVGLAQFLTASGQDVRFGVVPFDDFVPAQDGGASLPGGSPQVLPLIADAGAFEQWVEQVISATGGGDGPENSLDALSYAMDGPPTVNGVPVGPMMAWRKGAQRALVLMTDALMHHQGDGSSYTSVTVVDMLAALQGRAVVHTVSTPNGSTPFPDGSHVEARVLSCATGGTAADLGTFNQEAIEQALFANAIAQSYSCYYSSADPFTTHDVTVEVTYEQVGSALSGSVTQEDVSYLE